MCIWQRLNQSIPEVINKGEYLTESEDPKSQHMLAGLNGLKSDEGNLRPETYLSPHISTTYNFQQQKFYILTVLKHQVEACFHLFGLITKKMFY
jgi:hypothetical protein